MTSRARLPKSGFERETGAANPLLDSYLNELERPIQGVVEQDTGRSFIEETRSHLKRAIDDRAERGEPVAAATEAVLREYGRASLNATDFLHSWFECSIRTPLYRRFGRANMIAFGFLLAAAVGNTLILQANIYFPSEARYQPIWHLTPAQVRSVWPDPLPLPDLSVGFLLMAAWSLLSPFVAGFVVGWLIPVRPASAVLRGLLPIFVYSFLLGAQLFNSAQAAMLASMQLLYWIPTGCLGAFAGVFMARWRRKAVAK